MFMGKKLQKLFEEVASVLNGAEPENLVNNRFVSQSTPQATHNLVLEDTCQQSSWCDLLMRCV